VTQSGLYDFNLNTRGFNSSLNRRVPALVDGRDPTVPFLMSNDWPSMSSMSDMASVELVRGPSSALYGTNAFNGVLVLTTKQPRYSQGGMAQLTAGELSTLRGDVRWSGGLTDTSYLKVHGSYTQSDDFYRARNVAFDERETDFYRFCTSAADIGCIRRETAPLQREDDELWLAGVRFDQYLGNSFLTLEGGTSKAEGPVVQTGIGRVQVTESERPWARANFSHPRFNILAYTNQRDAPIQRALASGANLILDEENWAVEVQGNMDFAGTRGRLIGGASHKDEEIDTRTDAGVSTLTRFNPVEAERDAVYAQVEYAFTPKLKAVVAGRWDDSTLHDSQVSPKVALVVAPTPNQTLRFTYNQAFQSPNYSEFFLRAPAGLRSPPSPPRRSPASTRRWPSSPSSPSATRPSTSRRSPPGRWATAASSAARPSSPSTTTTASSRTSSPTCSRGSTLSSRPTLRRQGCRPRCRRPSSTASAAGSGRPTSPA
jgi:outer membrane receptor protein involved in Fe transport